MREPRRASDLPAPRPPSLRDGHGGARVQAAGERGDRLRLLGLLVLVAVLAPPARAYPAGDDATPGDRALAFRKQSKVWARTDVGAVDARVTSHPPDVTKLDRRLDAVAEAGGEVAFATRWGLRLDMRADYSKRRQSEQQGPRADVDETVVTYAPSVDLTFVTDKGLELFGGLLVEQHAPYTETVSAPGSTAQTRYARATAVARRVGVLRRAGPWSGGFYYVQGGQADRAFAKTASDGSAIAGTDQVFVPSRVAVFALVDGKPLAWSFELDFVQARGLGPKDEKGTSVVTDYFEARTGAAYDLGGGWGLTGGLFHKTLSYASSAFVSLDTIPVSSARAGLTFGSVERHLDAGLTYAFGKDVQSLPEFNAAYDLRALTLTAGLSTAL